ncbi:bifunctional nuclease 2 [Rhodamnia argentea]|uniref:Bifunctional nuclease 2 isoform X1 n=1 Tax=Rhodamnia argentea TaxID=178133 RepID=A0A8B8NNM7_9MYRT|nr:bifunctional nuclease 2 [Rhodamnia argentea]XP_030523745.1 bifunctional nuclease 2 [Rhodamnia argentea]XP_030523747.1 bifunctional nuclease 2 [Rhodamnia argentea]
MLAAHLCVRAISGYVAAEQSDASRLVAAPCTSSSLRVSVRLCRGRRRCRGVKPLVISCKSPGGGLGGGSSGADDGDGHDDYLQASLLLAETVSHYRMRRRGYQVDAKSQLSSQLHPFAIRARGPSVDQGFLHRFHSPTIFLKIVCDGSFLLPIVVGEYAIEKLIDALHGGENGGCTDQFDLVKDLTDKVGFEIKMVRITQRVANTYFARLYFSKSGKDDLLSVDLRPSDAINVAHRCKVPIYVNKQIILRDAIRFGYGTETTRDRKPVYDVLLDSASDSPDVLAEELDLVRNMNLAIKEERYNDAALWRDKLMKLRKSKT